MARYSIEGGDSAVAPQLVLDQFEYEDDDDEGIRGRWVLVGWEQFGTGDTAVLRLGNAAYINGSLGGMTESPSCDTQILADAARIRRVRNWAGLPPHIYTPTPSTTLTPGSNSTPTPEEP